MASSQRQTVQAIPPFKGGPLQATDVTNRRPTAAEAYVALANRKAGANVVSTRATGSENRSAYTASTNHHHRQPAAPAVDRRPPQQQAADRPKPTSRLEREKKRNHSDPKNIGHWRLDKLIGQGASGRVRLAIHDQTGQRAAVKIIPRTLINASRMSLRDADVKANKMILGIEREIVIMKLIEHPNLLGLWDVYETSKDLFLIMEYVAGGELFDHLVAQGKLSPSAARSYFRQIIFGMDYCHRFNICHRDLKPENLLLDETKKIVKVADFGMAALQPSEKMLETSCGSPHYASPEIVSGKRYKGTASDIWSCGIILFALLCGRLPFDDPNIQQLLGKVRAGKFAMPEWLEPASKDLIWRMLEVDPEKRIKMVDIMRHPWFTNNAQESSVNPVATSFEGLHMEDLKRETIDLDILGNLKTLWSEISEQEIVRELLAPGPNWQKTFYTLLAAHRENHSADDEEDVFNDDEIMTASIVPAHSLVTASAAQSLEKPRPRRVNEPGAASTPSSPHLESIAMDRRHSTPEKASQEAIVQPSTQARPPSPSPRIAPVAKAEPLLSSPTKVHAPSNKVEDFKLPQISLQTASPQRKERPTSDLQRRVTSPTKSTTATAAAAGGPSSRVALAGLNDTTGSSIVPVRPRVNRSSASEMMAPLPLPGPRASSRPVSPIKSSFGTIAPPVQQRPTVLRASTMQGPAPSIAVPEVGDATMQKFFQEIADELASIRATGEKPDALQSKVEQLKSSVVAQRAAARSAQAAQMQTVTSTAMERRTSGSTGSRTTPSPALRNTEANQFEDAEDDVSENESVRSEASTQPYTPSTPMSPFTPSEGTLPLPALEKGRVAPTSTARSTARSVRATASAGSSSGTNSRPTSVFSNISTGSNGLGRKRSILGLRRDKRSEDSDKPANDVVQSPQVLANVFATAPTNANAPTRVQQLNPGLGLNLGPSALAPSSAAATPLSPSVAPGKKDSWFAGLFNWKPASFTLMSTENFSETLSECVRRLQSYGVRVAMDSSSDTHHTTLKCTISEYRESNGSLAAAKPLRFRVEFTILPVGSATTQSPHFGLGLSIQGNGAGGFGNSPASPALSNHSRSSGVTFATSLQVVQEKGALSTFKLINGRLRRDWTLDQSSPLII